MGGVPASSTVLTGEVAWYLSGGLTDDQCLSFARATGAAVVRGPGGVRTGNKLRRAGFEGRLWLDPAAYERPAEPRIDLFGDHWQQIQLELGVETPISPGTYVAKSDAAGLGAALDVEGEWAEAVGGRLSLALHASWLTQGIGVLTERLVATDLPIALAFADRNDPLGRRGAVTGLSHLVRSVRDLAILRCDLGALGAVAHGASLGAIGTSATVRHVVPPGSTAGGVPRDKSPSVFLAHLLDFKLGSHLDEFPREASPVCDLACCRGAALRRFNGEHSTHEARTHNMLAIAAVARKVLAADSERRPAVFRAMCVDAEHAVEELAIAARRPMDVRPQVKAWSTLDLHGG